MRLIPVAVCFQGAVRVPADRNVGEEKSEHISVLILECFLLTC